MVTQVEVRALECPECHREPQIDDRQNYLGCSDCRARLGVPVNYVVKYPYSPTRVEFDSARAQFPGRGIWRWSPMLPVTDANPVALGEGNTPLLHLASLGKRAGMNSLYLKDEGTNPTGSHKDRLCAAAVTAARALHADTVAGASSGNHGVSLAAYAARAGLQCVISTMRAVPRTMKTLMEVYGARVEVFDSGSARFPMIAAGVRDAGWFPCTNSTMPPVGSTAYGVDGYKTIAYELWEQTKGAPIAAVVVPTGYGDCLLGVVRGFRDLHAAGVIEYWPRIIAAEVFDKIRQSQAHSQPTIGPFPSGATAAFSIGGGYTTYQALYALRLSRGLAINVPEVEILKTQAELARTEGIYAEASACVALAAARSARTTGLLSSDALTVVICTGNGVKDPDATEKWLRAQEARPSTLVRKRARGDDGVGGRV